MYFDYTNFDYSFELYMAELVEVHIYQPSDIQGFIENLVF